jgi:hypothetical protein
MNEQYKNFHTKQIHKQMDIARQILFINVEWLRIGDNVSRTIYNTINRIINIRENLMYQPIEMED